MEFLFSIFVLLLIAWFAGRFLFGIALRLAMGCAAVLFFGFVALLLAAAASLCGRMP